jgi:hypothetical protein
MKYKIKHKIIEEYYDSSDLLHVDDLYLLDHLDNFSVIARRDSSNRLAHGDRFFELISIEDRTAFRKFLFDHTEAPLLLRTDVGTAIVNKFLVPSSLLCVVSFLCSEKNGEAIELAMRKFPDSFYIPEHYERSEKRIDGVRMLNVDLSTVIKNHKYLLEKPYILDNDFPKNTVENFKRVVKSIFSLVGCNVRVSMIAELMTDGNFDTGLLKSFLLSMMMLARRIATDRTADIDFTTCGEGVLVTVSIKTEDPSGVPLYPEIQHFAGCAERNSMFFDAYTVNGIIKVQLSPNRKDWSLFGLKSPVLFDWDS